MAGTARRARTGRQGQLPRVLRSLAAAEEPLLGVARRVRTPGRGRTGPAPGSAPPHGAGDPSCHPVAPRSSCPSPLTGGGDLSFPRRDTVVHPPHADRRSGTCEPPTATNGPPVSLTTEHPSHPRTGVVHTFPPDRRRSAGTKSGPDVRSSRAGIGAGSTSGFRNSALSRPGPFTFRTVSRSRTVPPFGGHSAHPAEPNAFTCERRSATRDMRQLQESPFRPGRRV